MMPTISRLASFSPLLAIEFGKAALVRQQQAVLNACIVATSQMGLEAREVGAAIAFLRNGKGERAAIRQQVEALAIRFDDQYLKLDDEGDEASKPEALRQFYKARVATAWVFALSEDTGQLHEAVYEAILAMDDPAQVVQAVEKALR